nr:reverse transcriptase domain-containing protein [Tanacetum cinerariifolium]
MVDRTMEELLQEPTEGYGEAIIIPEILAKIFEIKTNLLQLVQANKFHGIESENPHTHISNFKRMTATLKYRDVRNDAIKLTLFPYSLEDSARIWYEKEPPNSILTWDDLVNKFVNQFFPPSKTIHLKNEISGFTQRFEETFGEAWDHFKEMLRTCPHHGFLELTQIDTDALKIIENKSKVRYLRSKSNVSMVNTNSRDSVSKTDDRIDKLADQILNLVEIVNKQVITPATAKVVEKTCVTCGGNFIQNQASTSGTHPSNIVPNPKGEMKAVTTRRGLAYEGPPIPSNPPLEKVVERDTEETTEKEHSNCPGSTARIQPLVVPISIPEPDVLRTQPKPTIPYPSRLNDQKLREKATNQIKKFFQIFHDLHFDISFANTLLLMPKFASTIRSLLTNKDKLFELAKVPLNENCSTMLLKKLPEKLGDPGKFLIPCDFPGMDVCHALADLGASINLMPLSIWKKLSLPELTPTRMTLELADRSITHPKGVAEDVFVKVGKFNFPTDFVVVDFEADPRVPLILGRSFLRTDVIDIACEEFVQDVWDFQYNPKSSNPALVSDPSISENDCCKEPIVKCSSPTLTPFGESDLFLEEIKNFLNDESIPTGIENSFYDSEGDILFLEKLLNEDPFQLPPMDLKLAKESKAKSSIEKPPELELKELPSHLEYAFLEDTSKLPVIIAKDLKEVEKEALIKVLKSHKRAIAWKISDIKGIDPRFCTHKILMDEDYKPAFQSQRRVNPKIHDVIQKEVLKLLDAGMIYPIFDSPWVSSIHCVPKKGGMTIVANENNELISTRLFTGWRVCIDYRKIPKTGRKQLSHALMELSLTDACPMACVMLPSKIEVDRAKLDVIAKLPHPTTVKGVRSFLGHDVDYLSKLVEVKVLPTNDARVVVKFLKSLFSRFGIPGAIISDRGTHFRNDQFTRVMIKYGVTHRLSTAYHPQTSGQVEVSNHGLKRILKRMVGENRASWLDKLDDALWAFRTAFKTSIGCTPYKLVYGKSCHLPIELEHRAYWALKHVNFNLKTAELSQPNGPNFKVNGHRVKHYFEGNIPSKTKDLHKADYTQLYDFLKYNQKEADELKAERLAKTQDPLALMENSNNPYVFPAPHQDQPSFNQNYLQQPMPNPEDIIDPTTAMNMALALMAKAFKLNYSTPTNNNQRISSNPRNMQIAQPGMNMGQDRQMPMVEGNGGNQFRQYAGQNVGNSAGYNDVIRNQNQIANGNLVAARAKGNAAGLRRRDAAYLQTQLLIAQKEEAGIQLQAKEYDLMATAADLDEIEEVNANCILMANLQQASTSGTQTDSAPVYYTDGSAEVHENCDDNEIFNIFTQEEQYTELLERIPESHQVPQNNNDVISEDTSVEQGGEIVEQHSVKFEETRALYELLYQNLAIEVEKVKKDVLKLVKKNMTNPSLQDLKIKKDVLKLVKKN